MFGLGVLFTAITTALICAVYSEPNQDIDFRSMLRLPGYGALKRDRRPSKGVNYSNFRPIPGSMPNSKLLALIKKFDRRSGIESDTSNENLNENKPLLYKYKKKDDSVYDQYGKLNENKLDADTKSGFNVQNTDNHGGDNKRVQPNRFNEGALQQLLSQKVLDKKYQNKPRNRVIPSSLVGSYSEDVKFDNGANDFSKIYIILNPKAIHKSKNKAKLNKWLEKILSLAQSSVGKKLEPRHNKEFPERRARRASRELSASRESEEEMYKPKRMRNGVRSRTAIPYIEQRGDIYEKDD